MLCYRALRSRDARFDGRFFTGVTTTGIYCRPICSARPPQSGHVVFFPCAAAAEEAGFRPCRRCRPESSPGSPAWLGTSATVTRGLRLIAEGALDRADVSDLARRLGIGERQLRRLFTRHLGASPLALARTRRAHFARRLIDQTSLSMTQAAFTSGFSSLRQFNATMRETFGSAPTELRAGGSRLLGRPIGNTGHPRPNSPGTGHPRPIGPGDPWPVGAGVLLPTSTAIPHLSLRLPYRAPFDWDGMISFLAPRATPGVEVVEPGFYRRSIRLPDGPGWLEIRPEMPHGRGSFELRLEVHAPIGRELVGLVERVRQLFDLEADPLALSDHLGRDPMLAPLLQAHPGLRAPGAWDGFELAVRALLGQQITVAGATTLAGRLAAAFGEPAPFESAGLSRLFPTPEILAQADVHRIGLPRARGEAVRELARLTASGQLDLTPAADESETLRRLRAIPGVGEWTAQYVAMRALRDPDAFPSSDLGLRSATVVAGVLPAAHAPRGAPGRATSAPPTPGARSRPILSTADLARRAEAWRPWRAYAAMHLWISPRPDRERLRPERGRGRARDINAGVKDCATGPNGRSRARGINLAERTGRDAPRSAARPARPVRKGMT